MQTMLTSSPRRVALAVLATALGCVVWLSGRSAGRHEARRLEEARREQLLPPSDQLGATVRALLHGRMRRHADSAERLWQAFLAVDYSAIARHAEELAAEPRLSEPAAGEDPSLVNAVIPPEFFVAQDALAASAAALVDAATARDPTKVTTTFQRTAASCFACHVHYRTGKRDALIP